MKHFSQKHSGSSISPHPDSPDQTDVNRKTLKGPFTVMCRKYLDFPIFTDRVSKATLTNSDNFSYLSVRGVFRDI